MAAAGAVDGDALRKELIDTIYSRVDGYEQMGDLAIDMMNLVPLEVLLDYKKAGDPEPEDEDDDEENGVG